MLRSRKRSVSVQMTNAEAKKTLREMRQKRREWSFLMRAARLLRKVGKIESALECERMAAKLLK